jgi:hypothetical protein
MPVELTVASQKGPFMQTMRRAADTLLLSIWVFGYSVLIRFFAAVQRVERLLSGFKRADAD